MPYITLRPLKKKTLLYLWLLRPTYVAWYYLYLWLLRPTYVGLLQIDGTGTFGVVWGSFGPIFVKFSWCSLLGSIWGVKYSQIFATGEANICWVQRSKGYDIVPFQKLVKNTKTAISLLQIKIFEQFFFANWSAQLKEENGAIFVALGQWEGTCIVNIGYFQASYSRETFGASGAKTFQYKVPFLWFIYIVQVLN